MPDLKERFIATLKPFIAEAFDEARFDLPLRDLGIDSVKLIQLIETVEQTCDVRLLDEDITPENFGTPRALLGLVSRRSRFCP